MKEKQRIYVKMFYRDGIVYSDVEVAVVIVGTTQNTVYSRHANNATPGSASRVATWKVEAYEVQESVAAALDGLGYDVVKTCVHTTEEQYGVLPF